MSALADALEAYEHAIACGAPSIEQASRFADLTALHRNRMEQLHEAEVAVERVWGRLLPCLDNEPSDTNWGDQAGAVL